MKSMVSLWPAYQVSELSLMRSFLIRPKKVICSPEQKNQHLSIFVHPHGICFTWKILLNHKQLVNSCNTTHNCAASGLVFIMVNNLCIWWSWSTFITSGSDKISRILASSSWEGGTAVCCLVLDLSVRPISLPCVLEALAGVFGKKF